MTDPVLRRRNALGVVMIDGVEYPAAVAISDPAERAAYLRWQAAYEATLTPEQLAKFRDGMVCT